MENKIIFTTEENEKVTFCVLEQTTLNGKHYLLVTEEDEDEEAQAYILKDSSVDGDEEAVYDIVEDEEELALIGEIFEQLLEDVDIMM